MVEEAGVPGENHRPWQETGKLYHLRLRKLEMVFWREKKMVIKITKYTVFAFTYLA
jgi:hypothetical protein